MNYFVKTLVIFNEKIFFCTSKPNPLQESRGHVLISLEGLITATASYIIKNTVKLLECFLQGLFKP